MKYETRITVQYYETDMMGIVHHSNYIRYFETARNDFFREIGYPYEKIEEDGIFVPVLDVSASYKVPAVFGEELAVICTIVKLGHASFEVEYEIRSAKDGTLHVTGTSRHGFTDKSFKPVPLRKVAPHILKVFQEAMGEYAG